VTILNEQKDIFFKNKAIELRLMVVEAVKSAGKGHIGGAFSMMDILTVLFYGGFLKYDAKHPKWNDRDWFLLSKGHSGVGLYAILSDCGYFSKTELNFLNQGSMLGEHPDFNIPGVEVVGGSLGHSLGIAGGVALANRLDGKDKKIVVMMGDGECNEGSVWEAALFAAHHKLSNIWVIIDRNKLMATNQTEEVNKLDPMDEKWASFGWKVINTDAHNVNEIQEIFNTLENSKPSQPIAIIANSIKGKGVSFMENKVSWHHGGLSPELYEQAKKELKLQLVG